MKVFPVGVAAVVAAALTLTGCSSDSDDSGSSANEPNPSVATDESPVESPDEAPAENATPAEDLGAVRVNDAMTYPITELRNCEPLSDGTIERELELQGFGEYEGERVQIDVYVQTIGGVGSHDVSWSGPEGVFGNPSQARITWGPDNATILGSATLVDGLTQSERLMVSFDLTVPEETVACR